MEVSVQHHAPDALLPRKMSPLPTLQENGWAQELIWTCWSRWKLFFLVRN